MLDPFCGCGTAVAAAEKLGRQWLGIDVTHLAVALMKNRLKTAFDLEPGRDYGVVGEPVDAGSARALWEQDPYQFQFWAVSLLEAQPQSEQRRGADRGHRRAAVLHRRPTAYQPQDHGSGQGRAGVVAPGPGPQGGGGAGEGGLGTVHQPGRAPPGTCAPKRPAVGCTTPISGRRTTRRYSSVQFPSCWKAKASRFRRTRPRFQAAPRVRRAEGRQSTLGEAG